LFAAFASSSEEQFINTGKFWNTGGKERKRSRKGERAGRK
jgi:hypothetical protein